ncbi:sensor histidine kinase [Mycobacterium sp. CBMA293]|uniref:GAF domain-containing sensor histidine kinase n=2 Tax=Mycolicibacterium TaxID=1866885 RepID=UPI0012DFA184|nr:MULTISPECIES: GAF domain-containing protein [unclassified Mycolicibacterium]MUL48743.1 sensor histidine kinase [Mycolicibacterium sp. CBMA 360]MUL62197.1 sensor histidine kinase [Mycolicibacterium sp. CBMA 335]MUL71658.1 sensor histidine kinase [Mycolicibacterium sp. CBMA 311]MUL93613.1 sensor histidine kinase [Mycolicibacterium sp. CBMA 230]MUM09294.1 histidine kinase [Mycolicibacterium sp. CBMA 213]
MSPARWNPGISTPPWYVGIVVAAGLIAAEIAVVRLLHDPPPHSTYAIVFMFGVLIVSAGWDLSMSVPMTIASALAYLQVHLDGGPLLPIKPVDALTLAVFLPVAGVANVLGWQLRSRAREAHRSWRVATEATERVRELAEQQGALRRVATLIAEGSSPSDILSSVTDEVASVLHVHNAALVRYESDGTATLVAAHDEPGLKTVSVGTTFTLDGDDVIATVRATSRPARLDTHEQAAGSAAALVRDLGLQACVGVPVTVDGKLWGAVIVGSFDPGALPADTEACLADFAELIATAIANAHARAELVASRARIVTASDNARRSIERDLHDGAQQRLVTLALQVRTLQQAVPEDPSELVHRIAGIGDGLRTASDELRELAHGVHPAILSRGGLRPALRDLGRRAPLPVEVHVDVPSRLPEAVEIAAYYTVAEALTNAAKHAKASVVTVDVACDTTCLRITVADDGVGGAAIDAGSGLVGLEDRVAALGGKLHVASTVGVGTTLRAEMPLTVGGTDGG